MSKYIDADDVDKIICRKIETTKTFIEHDALIDVKFKIEDLPIADVEPALELQKELSKLGQSINANGSMVNWMCDVDRLIKNTVIVRQK